MAVIKHILLHGLVDLSKGAEGRREGGERVERAGASGNDETGRKTGRKERRVAGGESVRWSKMSKIFGIF